MVNDGEVRVYERGICQNLHFDHRWYIFPSLIRDLFPLALLMDYSVSSVDSDDFLNFSSGSADGGGRSRSSK